MTAVGTKATVQEAIRDTLRDELPAYLTTVKEEKQPTFLLTPVIPMGNQLPAIGIYDDGGDQEDLSGYVVRKLGFAVYIWVSGNSEEDAAERAMEYVDAIRGCLEENYTLGGVVVLTEIEGEEPTGPGIQQEAGGTMQAGGLRIMVTVGHLRGAATLG